MRKMYRNEKNKENESKARHVWFSETNYIKIATAFIFNIVM